MSNDPTQSPPMSIVSWGGMIQSPDQPLEISALPGCVQVRVTQVGPPGTPSQWVAIRVAANNDDIEKIITLLRAARDAAGLLASALPVNIPPGRHLQ